MLMFLRNKVVEVEPRPEGDLLVSWRLTDDLYKIEVRLVVQPPDLEIIQAEARLERFVPRSCRDASERIKKVEGVSIGGGLRKILTGLLGGKDGCSILTDAVLECCNAVLIHFTRPELEFMSSCEDPEERIEATRKMVGANPRLIGSCIAFQSNSPIMKGLTVKEGQ